MHCKINIEIIPNAKQASDTFNPKLQRLKSFALTHKKKFIEQTRITFLIVFSLMMIAIKKLFFIMQLNIDTHS
jgi:hypothetical protein